MKKQPVYKLPEELGKPGQILQINDQGQREWVCHNCKKGYCEDCDD